jgi:hypothetical protein
MRASIGCTLRRLMLSQSIHRRNPFAAAIRRYSRDDSPVQRFDSVGRDLAANFRPHLAAVNTSAGDAEMAQKNIVTVKSIKVSDEVVIPAGSFGHIEIEREDKVKIYVEAASFDTSATAYNLWVSKSDIRIR